MSLQIRIRPSDEARRVLERHEQRRSAVRRELSDAHRQGIDEIAGHLRSRYLRGGDPNSPRGGRTPLAVRTGALIGSIDAVQDDELSGRVGSMRGAATKYAGVHLGDETWTLTPKTAKYLWIPIGTNRRKDGIAKISPREAREAKGPKGGKLLSIFTSKKGNVVAFLRDAVKGGTFKRGPNKGRQRGKLLFILKKSVTIEGTDALAKAVEDKRPRLLEMLQAGIDRGMTAPGNAPGSAPGSGGTGGAA